jgi:hypothetical protein
MASLCPACKHETITSVIPIQGQRYAVCAGCQTVYLDLPKGAEAGGRGPGGRPIWRSGPALGDHQRQQLAAILARAEQREGRALVVEKSGRRAMVGTFDLPDAVPGLQAVATAGTEVRLSELPQAVKQAAGRQGPCAAAVVAGALERLADPDPLFEALAGAIGPKGRLLLVTPNAAFARIAANARRRQSRQLDDALGEVLDPGSRKLVCSVAGVTALLRRHGFGLVRVRPAAVTPLAGTAGAFQVAVYAAFSVLQAIRPMMVLSHYMVCIAQREG